MRLIEKKLKNNFKDMTTVNSEFMNKTEKVSVLILQLSVAILDLPNLHNSHQKLNQ